jgi:hypothetical protein
MDIKFKLTPESCMTEEEVKEFWKLWYKADNIKENKKEEECDTCKRMKDLKKKCWWCGN